MVYSRLLLAALCLSFLPAFAQDRSLNSGDSGRRVQQAPDFRTASAGTPSEPWRILPKRDSDQDKSLTLAQPDLGTEGVVLGSNGALAPESMCYSIRSYVVARDSKHSDSVHPAGYTTCVPASRYRLKTADDHMTR